MNFVAGLYFFADLWTIDCLVPSKQGQNRVCRPGKRNGTERNRIFKRNGTMGPLTYALPILTTHEWNWVYGPYKQNGTEEWYMIFYQIGPLGLLSIAHA